MRLPPEFDRSPADEPPAAPPDASSDAAAVLSLHVPMRLWPADCTEERGFPPSASVAAAYEEALECRVQSALAALQCMPERLWGASPSRQALRIDCWVSRRNFVEGIPAVEDLARQHGLCWDLPECGEVAHPTRLSAGRTLRDHLEQLWEAREGWMILEAGPDLDWYVQVMLDHEGPVADVEAVAGRFANPRLNAEQRRSLLSCGFAVSADREGPNASRTQRLDCPAARAALAETMQRVMREVYGVRDCDPVVIRLRR